MTEQPLKRWRTIWAYCQEARPLRSFHKYMTIGWLLFSVPVLLLPGWKESVALLVFVSIYANVVGHFSSWQASRVEVKQDDAD